MLLLSLRCVDGSWLVVGCDGLGLLIVLIAMYYLDIGWKWLIKFWSVWYQMIYDKNEFNRWWVIENLKFLDKCIIYLRENRVFVYLKMIEYFV